MQSKTCTKCKKIKQLTQFAIQKEATDGRSSWCKACKVIRQKELAQEYSTKPRETPSTKCCSRCRAVKPVSDFYLDSLTKSGFCHQCKDCCRETGKDANIKFNKERKRKKIQYYRDNEEYARYHHIYHLFNLTMERYKAILNSQDGKCAICRSENNNGRRWHIDHDRKCCPGKSSCGGCIRGLLCQGCNTGIGNLREKEEIFLAAIKYVQDPPAYKIPFESKGEDGLF